MLYHAMQYDIHCITYEVFLSKYLTLIKPLGLNSCLQEIGNIGISYISLGTSQIQDMRQFTR